MKRHKKILLLLLATAAAFAADGLRDAAGQSVFNRMKCISAAKSLTTEESLRTEVEYLSGGLCGGRASATRGGCETAMHICHLFGTYGLMPMSGNGSFVSSFDCGGRVCRNVIGMVPSASGKGSGKYILVMAHYDGIGCLEGKVYPGADSNASGVAVMLALAKMFSAAVSGRGGYIDKNIIFVGLDAKQLNMAGSKSLWEAFRSGDIRDPLTGRTIRPSNLTVVVNLDILGSSASPLKPGRGDYMIMLGGNDFMKQQLTAVNNYTDARLDIGLNYYGSKSFTDLFLNKVSDQRPFLQGGVRSVMFTSGITMDTNKETDTPDKIDWQVLRRRTMLIYHWLDRMTYLL